MTIIVTGGTRFVEKSFIFYIEYSRIYNDLELLLGS